MPKWAAVTRVAKHGGNTLPCVEFKDADVFIRAAGGYILTRRIKLNLSAHTHKKKELHSQRNSVHKAGARCVECGGQIYPEKASIFTHWPLVELLLFATADVKNPAARGERHLVDFLLLISLILINTRTHVHTHLMQRSWQPTAAYLQVGSTAMSYSVVFLTVWCDRRNLVPLSVWFTLKKKKRNIWGVWSKFRFRSKT